MKNLSDYTYHQDASGVIYHGDCLKILPLLPKVDLVLTDPPYGIEYEKQFTKGKWDKIENDNKLMDFRCILNMDCGIVSFGANYYPQLLPHRGRWICWDKRVNLKADKMLGAPFELAWCNKLTGFEKIYRVMHGGVVNSDGGKRYHPTQKPVKLFKMIICDYGESQTILDPFLGSGTTAVAAKQLGRKYIGIEISKKYCEIAKQRLQRCEFDIFYQQDKKKKKEYDTLI